MKWTYLKFLAEADSDPAFTRGERIDWRQFRINLAAHAASTNNPLQRLDAIMWLGIAGHREAPTMAEPVRIEIGGILSNWAGAEGVFAPGMGIGMSPSLYPQLNATGQQGENEAEALSHELRHRGFRIIGRISSLLSRMPSEFRSSISRDSSGSTINDAEHSMIYAMDGIDVSRGSPIDASNSAEVRRWRNAYRQCNEAVRGWLADQPIPRGAPEELRQDLERIYGKPVEFVAPDEVPETPAEAVAEDEAVVIVVPPRVADQAEKPDLSSISTTRDNTLARQSASGSAAGRSGTELLQQALNYLGADPELDVDGKYGPKTRQAVRNFQQQHGLTVDGLAGPQTMGKIRELLGQRTDRPTTGSSRGPDDGTRGGQEPNRTPASDVSRPTPTQTPRPRPNRGPTDSYNPWKTELEAAGFVVSPSGRFVRTQDGATIAGFDPKHGTPWIGTQAVADIVYGRGNYYIPR